MIPLWVLFAIGMVVVVVVVSTVVLVWAERKFSRKGHHPAVLPVHDTRSGRPYRLLPPPEMRDE